MAAPAQQCHQVRVSELAKHDDLEGLYPELVVFGFTLKVLLIQAYHRGYLGFEGRSLLCLGKVRDLGCLWFRG